MPRNQKPKDRRNRSVRLSVDTPTSTRQRVCIVCKQKALEGVIIQRHDERGRYTHGEFICARCKAQEAQAEETIIVKRRITR
jgi:hypothetical protein